MRLPPAHRHHRHSGQASCSKATVCNILKTFSANTSSSPAPLRFLVSFQVATRTYNGHMLRRQDTTGSFITFEGAATANCLESLLYSINALGQLSVTDGRIFSFSKRVGSARFVPSTSVGGISTTWELSGPTLRFDNSTFLNGTATLCLDTLSNTIEVYYLEAPPITCSPVVLTVASRQYFFHTISLLPNAKQCRYALESNKHPVTLLFRIQKICPPVLSRHLLQRTSQPLAR